MSLSKIKICFVTGEYQPTIGGLSTSATRISKMLSEAGFEMHVIVPVDGIETSKLPTPEKLGDISIYRIPTGEHLQKKLGMTLAKMIQILDNRLNFDLFHGFFLPMSYTCVFALKNRPRPLITSIRGSDAKIWADPKMSNLLNVVLKHTSCLTTVNKKLLNNLVKNSILEIDPKFIKNSVSIHSASKWTSNNLVKGKIGALGKFQQCKNINTLLESYNKLGSNIRSNLILVGDFPDHESKRIYEDKLDSLNLRDEVSLTGFLNKKEVYSQLKQLSVFVSTSSSEGFPNAMLEAASLGIPIVAANFEGLEDYCTHEKNALIVPIGDIAATARAITSILTNNELAKKLSSGALELAKSVSPDTEKQQWVKLYKDYTAKKT